MSAPLFLKQIKRERICLRKGLCHTSFKKKKPDMLNNDKEHPKKGERETCLTKISDF